MKAHHPHFKPRVLWGEGRPVSRGGGVPKAKPRGGWHGCNESLARDDITAANSGSENGVCLIREALQISITEK